MKNWLVGLIWCHFIFRSFSSILTKASCRSSSFLQRSKYKTILQSLYRDWSYWTATLHDSITLQTLWNKRWELYFWMSHYGQFVHFCFSPVALFTPCFLIFRKFLPYGATSKCTRKYVLELYRNCQDQFHDFLVFF